MSIISRLSEKPRAVPRVPRLVRRGPPNKPGRRRSIGDQVEPGDFLAHDPVRHRVDVKTDHIAAEPVRLQERGAAARERIGHASTLERIGEKEALRERTVEPLTVSRL